MAKSKLTPKNNLIAAMADNSDLTLEARAKAPIIGDPTHPSYEDTQPQVPEEVTALMIMAGVTARWTFDHWTVSDKHGKRTGVSAVGSFDEWRGALNYLAGGDNFA